MSFVCQGCYERLEDPNVRHTAEDCEKITQLLSMMGVERKHLEKRQ